jgi:GntR family transcriptional regulator, transcriptional repressor for pyruvate dehydrogenase complex
MSSLFENVVVNQTRLGEAVSEHLARAILDGTLKLGDVLPSEGKIAETFGVSKQIAREAIRELAAIGIVQVQQGKVSRVCDLSVEPLSRIYQFAMGRTERGLREVTQVRRILEPEIARMAAEHRSEADVARLQHALDEMRFSVGDVTRWIDADLAFHETLGDISGNSFLKLQLTALREVVRQVHVAFNARKKRGQADWLATLQRHVDIFEAVARADPDGAFMAMKAHFEAADEAIRELFPDPASLGARSRDVVSA